MRAHIHFYLISLFFNSANAAVYAPNGRCGSQYNNALCDPSKGGKCCSKNGFCGDTAEYCLRSNDCQLNCTDDVPPGTTLTPTAAITMTNLPPANPTATIIISTPTPTPAPSGGLTAKERGGLIVGSILGSCLIFCLMVWIRWKHKEKRQDQSIQMLAIQSGTPTLNIFTTDNRGLEQLVNALPASGSRNLRIGAAPGG
ncbi:hypothetical protein BDV96DRAFT_644385 [Lophiotrema nucula]|uniref:Chitin-binding type-1 domain-containing protein n=1 Tax=Lophiotrema nucula TaxID=690887 RepID=A0A6A5ZGL1_9PLEO|nr:hypothetical protein BDV96DRAFT_644385 [Lophiotrema nucula]